jgi:hypothetical protein
MTNSGPHHSDMGKREFRQMLTAIFRASGQVSGAPSSVSDHDFARMSAPISPPPARKWGRAIMPRPSLPEVLQLRSLWHRAPNASDRSLDRDRPLMEGSEVRRVAIAVAHASVMPESARRYKRARLRAYLLPCSCCISSSKLLSPSRASLRTIEC